MKAFALPYLYTSATLKCGAWGCYLIFQIGMGVYYESTGSSKQGRLCREKLLIPWNQKILIPWKQKILIPWNQKILIPWNQQILIPWNQQILIPWNQRLEPSWLLGRLGTQSWNSLLLASFCYGTQQGNNSVALCCLGLNFMCKVQTRASPSLAAWNLIGCLLSDGCPMFRC
jgi:hypothetical protein